MPSLEGYRSHLDYSYAPGIFPAMECLLHRPEKVRHKLDQILHGDREQGKSLQAFFESCGL